MRYGTVRKIEEIAITRIKLRLEYSLFFEVTVLIISIVPYDSVKMMEMIPTIVWELSGRGIDSNASEWLH